MNVYDQNEVTEDGIDIFSSDLHQQNAKSLIEVIKDGIIISLSDEHPKNKLTSITVTEGRIDT